VDWAARNEVMGRGEDNRPSGRMSLLFFLIFDFPFVSYFKDEISIQIQSGFDSQNEHAAK
jgi:hypothetical protein